MVTALNAGVGKVRKSSVDTHVARCSLTSKTVNGQYVQTVPTGAALTYHRHWEGLLGLRQLRLSARERKYPVAELDSDAWYG